MSLDVAKAFDTVDIDGPFYKEIFLKFSPLVLTLHKNMYYNSHTQGPVCGCCNKYSYTCHFFLPALLDVSYLLPLHHTVSSKHGLEELTLRPTSSAYT